MRQSALAFCLVLLASATSSGHYNMLLPDKPWAKKDEKVTFTYQYGHPYENELFDAPEPHAIHVILPEGKTQKIDKLTKISVPGAEGKKVTAYRFDYIPEARGDHTFVLQTPLIWMEESKSFIQDSVKVVLHVQTQKNWDAPLPAEVEHRWSMVPITRPYGLLPGMVFRAEITTRASSYGISSLSQVEVEKYNPAPPKKLPPDELITFRTKANAGEIIFAFPEPGWWSVTATRPWRDPNRKKLDGKEGLVQQRATLWVHVDEKK